MMQRPSGGCATALAAAMALTLVALGWLYRNQDLFPPNSLPWKPVNLAAAPNWLAHWQMNGLRHDRQACMAALKTAPGLRASPLQDRRIDDRCGFEAVVRADASPVSFIPRVTATCGMTAALAWYQQELGAAAMVEMGSRLVSISQLGTFSCRNVNNERDGRRSEHANANAIDIAVFHFADGRTASVAGDYGKSTAAGHFLDAAHDEACGFFNAVLGPRYNKLHANHFHLDMGAYRICS
jgi:hypothetical protein